MNEEKLKEIAARYFDLYPERKVLYATADGNVFLDRNPAIDHARKASIKWFEVTKADQAAEKLAQIDPEQQMKEQLQAEALTINPETGNYRDMLRILAGLHLMPESRKKEDVQVAFANLLASLPTSANEVATEAANETEIETPETEI